MAVDISAAYRSELLSLAKHIGVSAGNLDDEHERWRIYRVAMEKPATVSRIFASVSLETDMSLKSAVVVQMLERVESKWRGEWVSLLSAENRDFAQLYVWEIAVLEGLRCGEYDSTRVIGEMDAWSNRLQLRAVNSTSDESILRAFAQRGRTRRIRNAAIRKL